MTNKESSTNINPQDDLVSLFTRKTSRLLPDQHGNKREGSNKGVPIAVPTASSPVHFSTISTRFPSRSPNTSNTSSTSIIKNMKGKYKEKNEHTSISFQANNYTSFKTKGTRLKTSNDSKSRSYSKSKDGSTNLLHFPSKDDLILPKKQYRIMDSYSSHVVEKKRQNISPLSKRKSSRLENDNRFDTPNKRDRNYHFLKSDRKSSIEDEVIILSPDQTSSSKFNDQDDDEKYNNSPINTSKQVNIPSKLEFSDKKLQDLTIDPDNNRKYKSISNTNNIGSTPNSTEEEHFFSADLSPKSITHTEQNATKSISLASPSDNNNNTTDDNDMPIPSKASTSESNITDIADLPSKTKDKMELCSPKVNSPLKTDNSMKLCSPNTNIPVDENQRYQLRKKKKAKKYKVVNPEDELLFTYPSKNSKNAISIYVRDQYKLEPETFLNDSIIDFYIKWSHDNYSKDCAGLPSPSDSNNKSLSDVHVFNSFFYTRITQTRTRVISEEIYTAVQNWTSGIDLFSKKYLIIPINEDNHWYLVLVSNIALCIPKKQRLNMNQDEITSEELINNKRSTLYIIDSLHGKHDKCVKNVIKYLCLEAKYKHTIAYEDFIKPNIKYPQVPRQDNVFDCGIYLLHFVELFMESSQKFIETLEDNNSQDYFWRTDDITCKRSDILSIFDKLKKKEN